MEEVISKVTARGDDEGYCDMCDKYSHCIEFNYTFENCDTHKLYGTYYHICWDCIDKLAKKRTHGKIGGRINRRQKQ